jgi:hypothetical protein
LCFADLRIPAAAREPVSVPAAPAPTAAVQTAAPVALASPEAVVAGIPTPATTSEAAPATPEEAAAAVAKEATWPCPRCAAAVLISLDECPDCGAGFLSGAALATSTKLPLVGDVGRMSQGQRLLTGAGISIVLMAIFVMLLFIGGKLFG